VRHQRSNVRCCGVTATLSLKAINQNTTVTRRNSEGYSCSNRQMGGLVQMASLQPSSHSALRNETTSLACSHITNSFLATEPSLKATCSLFSKKPLSTDLVTSSLQIIHSRSGKKSRVIVELTFLCAISVNSNIPIQTYLGDPFTCSDALASLIHLLIRYFSRRTYAKLNTNIGSLLAIFWVTVTRTVILWHHFPFGLRSSGTMYQHR